MHICHLVLNNIGGAPKVADTLISAEVRAGDRVSTIVLTDVDGKWPLAFQASQLVKIMRVNGDLFYIGGAIHQLSIAIALDRVLTEIQPDIIVAHTAFVTKLLYLSQAIGRSSSIPYIAYLHSDFRSELEFGSPLPSWGGLVDKISIAVNRWMSTRALQRSSGIIIVCKTLAERLPNLGLDPDRIVVSYNPVMADAQILPLHPTAQSWLDRSDLVTFVCAARFHPQKDHHTLLRAFAKASQTYSNIRLILLGDGDLEADIKALAHSLGIDEMVLFAGSVLNPRAYFARSRAVILPSHFEGFGLVSIEAVASNVTFIASDCPVGPREISEVLNCGTLVEPNNVDSLATAIEYHVTTPPEIIDRREQIDRLFSESSCANNLKNLISQIKVNLHSVDS
jgi:glycosyltransferase involved in cell wall biosynthesis